MKKSLLIISIIFILVSLFFSYIWYENHGRQLSCETFYSDEKEWVIIGNGTYGTERFACENKNIRKIIITNENNFPVDIRHYYKFPLPSEMQEENDLPIWQSSVRTPTSIMHGETKTWIIHDNVPLSFRLYSKDYNKKSRWDESSFYFERELVWDYKENTKEEYFSTDKMWIGTPKEEKARSFPPENICLVRITLSGGLDKEQNLRWTMATQECK